MLMALDMFAFEIGTLPYQELQRRWSWRHAQAERFGARPASQFLGPGAEDIELTGALHPGEGIGAYSAIDTLRDMAGTGDAFTLVTGVGEVLGEFFIRGIELRQDLFFVDGAARRSDFRLTLERADG